MPTTRKRSSTRRSQLEKTLIAEAGEHYVLPVPGSVAAAIRLGEMMRARLRSAWCTFGRVGWGMRSEYTR
jgi:hypothetical protein